MKFSLPRRLFEVIGFLLLANNSQALTRTVEVGYELPVIPLRLLVPAFQDESALENLFAFDPYEDLAEDPTEVEIFLDLNFQNHPSLSLPAQSGISSDENPKKLILDFREFGDLDNRLGSIRTVKFLEIRFSNLAEIRQFLSQGSNLAKVPNLRFIFLKAPANISPEEIGNLLESSPLSDYRVFFSIDSSK